MAHRVILDTDIGTDVDDCLALALILCSPELSLEGVTCVYGDVELRARMVLRLLRLRGRSDIPVFLGASKPILGVLPVYWAGHEGEGLLTQEDTADAASREHAVDFLVRSVMEQPGQIHVIAIGPLTNVALAFAREPRMVQHLAHLTIMGGVARGPQSLHLPYVEHNIKCDPEAAHMVFSAGAPMTVVPLDVTTRVSITRQGAERIREAGTPFHVAVADQVMRYPRLQSQGTTFIHDPLAVATVIEPDLVGLQSVHIDVEMGGQHTAGATLMRVPTETAPENARVALTVQAQRFEAMLIDRLVR